MNCLPSGQFTWNVKSYFSESWHFMWIGRLCLIFSCISLIKQQSPYILLRDPLSVHKGVSGTLILTTLTLKTALFESSPTSSCKKKWRNINITIQACDYMSRAMQKSVFGHMQTAKAQISLHICAVWPGPLLSESRIIGYYKMFPLQDFGYVQDDVNLHMLCMLEGIFISWRGQYNVSQLLLNPCHAE